MRPTRPYGTWHELERLELGDRVARAYDEDFEIAYRFVAAFEGLTRSSQAGSVRVLDLQRRWIAARSRERL